MARGELTPLYHDFGINVTGRGASGILGHRGTLAGLARGVATWFANQTRIRPNNPEKPGRAPMTIPISHRFVSPPDQLVSFVWLGLRDALLAVVKK